MPIITDPIQRQLIDYVNTLVGASATWLSFFFQGAIAASEYLTYDAKKLYLIFESLYSSTGAVWASVGVITLYDNTNAVNGYIENNYVHTPATPNYTINTITVNNYYFSRITASGLGNMILKGYKITWP